MSGDTNILGTAIASRMITISGAFAWYISDELSEGLTIFIPHDSSIVKEFK